MSTKDEFTDLEILNGLRNPWGWKQEDLNVIRLKAADRIDDLKAKNKELLEAIQWANEQLKPSREYLNPQHYVCQKFDYLIAKYKV